jgi:hypothetical protein
MLRTNEFDQFFLARELSFTIGVIWDDYIKNNLRIDHFTVPKEMVLDGNVDIIDIAIQRVEDELSIYKVHLPICQHKFFPWKEPFRNGTRYYLIETLLSGSYKNIDIDVLKANQRYKNISEIYSQSKIIYFDSIERVKQETGYGFRYVMTPNQART